MNMFTTASLGPPEAFRQFRKVVGLEKPSDCAAAFSIDEDTVRRWDRGETPRPLWIDRAIRLLYECTPWAWARWPAERDRLANESLYECLLDLADAGLAKSGRAFDKAQRAFAHYIGVNEKTVRRWCQDKRAVPTWMPALLALMFIVPRCRWQMLPFSGGKVSAQIAWPAERGGARRAEEVTPAGRGPRSEGLAATRC